MITRVVYNNKAFKIIDEYSTKFSNNEVTFNDIKIDFTNRSIADIPYKYQEIKIMQAENEKDILNGKILFTGFLDEIEISEMKKKKEFREMTLTLLSPLKMATKRTLSLIGTYEVQDAIERILQPLVNDGFIIKEINVTDGQITTNFVLETIENCMNTITSKRNIFWFINELKEIYVNSIDYLFGKPVTKTLSDGIQEKGLLKIQPTIENVDYANIINFKNVRLIYGASVGTDEMLYYPIIKVEKKIKNGDTITFDNPVIVDENQLRNVKKETNNDDINYYCLAITIALDTDEYKNYLIGLDVSTDKFFSQGNITYSDDDGEEGEIVLQRDSFYSNLITGFKWNGESGTIEIVESVTALRYTTMRFMYSKEIENMKDIISESGEIERTIDYNETWTTLTELINYARSLMVQNSNYVNQVVLEYDINPNLKIGDIVEIERPDFYIQGKFAVKDINYTYVNEIEQKWELTLKSSDFISSYIDMFRPTEQEESENTINTVILSEFIEEEIKETHTVELERNGYTLNFNLEE